MLLRSTRNYSLASRKTVAFAGGVSPLPYSASGRCYITLSVARPAGFVNNITMPHSERSSAFA